MQRCLWNQLLPLPNSGGGAPVGLRSRPGPWRRHQRRLHRWQLGGLGSGRRGGPGAPCWGPGDVHSRLRDGHARKPTGARELQPVFQNRVGDGNTSRRHRPWAKPPLTTWPLLRTKLSASARGPSTTAAPPRCHRRCCRSRLRSGHAHPTGAGRGRCALWGCHRCHRGGDGRGGDGAQDLRQMQIGIAQFLHAHIWQWSDQIEPRHRQVAIGIDGGGRSAAVATWRWCHRGTSGGRCCR
mmetsp:Transcript_141489/g.368643  ORF Transcript_141489/g.368643 Transcript_141489/m.368643 type:complete len:239 (+) Transcript_141489:79-795(+)